MSNSSKGQSRTDNAQSTRPTITLSDNLVDHLKDPRNVRQARLILRAWFLSDTLLTANSETLNSEDVEDNINLYMLLDDFLSNLSENA